MNKDISYLGIVCKLYSSSQAILISDAMPKTAVHLLVFPESSSSHLSL